MRARTTDQPATGPHATPGSGKEDLERLHGVLRQDGLRGALRLLNAHAPHRFTGVYRFDGDMLRCVALFDRWNPDDQSGADAPMAQTFCAIVPTQGDALEVVDGRSDQRFPWMNENPVVCYCGALLRDESGQPFGTLCHFDVQPCEAGSTQVPLLLACAPLIYQAVVA